MTKTKRFIMVSVGLVLAGALLTGIGAAFGGSVANIQLDRSGFHIRPSRMKGNQDNAGTQIQDKTPLSSFSMVDISLKYGDITVIPSDGYYLEYRLSGRRETPEWGVSEDCFTFRSLGYRGDEYQGINFALFSSVMDTEEEREYVNLYVPSDAFFRMWKMSLAHGDADVKGIEAGDCTMDLQYSDLVLQDSGITNLSLNEQHGDITLLNLDVGQLILDTQYSEMDFRHITAENILAGSRHGSLSAREISNVSVTVDSEYVDLDLVGFSSRDVGISSDHGTVSMDLKNNAHITVDNTYTDLELKTDRNIEDYQVQIKTEYGDIRVNDEDYEDGFASDSSYDGNMTIRSTHGNVEVRTRQ